MLRGDAANQDQNLDFSQEKIFSVFISYIKVFRKDFNIKSLESGHCWGYTVVLSYAMWLHLTQEVRVDEVGDRIPRDDWPYFEKAFNQMFAWDRRAESIKKKSKRHLRRNIERILSLLIYYQCQDDSPLNTKQLDVHQNLQDTRDRRFEQEYLFSGLFSGSDFFKKITLPRSQGRATTLLEELIQEDRIVLIANSNHVVGVIKHGDVYFYLSSNSSVTWKVYSPTQLDVFVRNFLIDLNFSLDKLASISFFMINPNKNTHIYPPQEVLHASLGRRTGVMDPSHQINLTALHVAADCKDNRSFSYFLRHPPIDLNHFVNIVNADGLTALHIAASNLDEKNVEALLQAGADPNASTNNSLPYPLHIAASVSRSMVVAMLLHYGANPNVRDKDQDTPLHIAVINDDCESIRWLLRSSAKYDVYNSEGDTPLHMASRLGSLRAVRLLVEAGANINKRRRGDVISVVAVAAYAKRFNILNYLMGFKRLHIDRHDHFALALVSKAHPNEERLNNYLVKAQPRILHDEMVAQLRLLRTQNIEYYMLAEAIFDSCLLENAHIQQPRKRVLAMLAAMLPVLLPVTPKSKWWWSLWAAPDSSHPILELMQQFGLTMEEVHNYSRGQAITCNVM